MLKKIDIIIPAAGRSRRFKYNKSKIFFKIKNKSLIEIIIEKIINYTNKIIIITKHQDKLNLKKIINKKFPKRNIILCTQKKIDGMATAIQLGLEKVENKNFFVIWSDQIYITKKTIFKTIKNHINNKNYLTFPICLNQKPYTKVIFYKKKFQEILHSREGNDFKSGYSDCGIFAGKTEYFKNHLKKYIKNKKILTKITNEYDFLKSFKYIKNKLKIKTFKIRNIKESKGINYLTDVI